MSDLERILEEKGVLDEAAATEEEDARPSYEGAPPPDLATDTQEEAEDDEESPDPEDAEEDASRDVEDDEKPEQEAQVDPDKPRTVKLTIDDAEVEVAEEELARSYKTAQQAKRWQQEARKSLEKASEKEEALSAIFSTFKDNPIKAALQVMENHLGDSEAAYNAVLEHATELLKQHVEEKKRPELRERRLLEEEKKRWQEVKQREELKEQQAQEQALLEQLDNEAKEALEGVGLTEETIGQKAYHSSYADLMQLRAVAFEAGENLTARQAADIVREDLETRQAQLLRTKPEALLEKFPDETRKISHSVAAALQKQQGQKRPKRVASPSATERVPEREPISNPREWARRKFEQL